MGDQVFDRVFEHGVHAGRVDPEKGVVYGAKIAGLKSLHGRDYTDDVYHKNRDKYEGMVGYTNHAGGASGRKRGVEDAFCVYHNPVVVPGDGVRADIHVLDPQDPFSRKFLRAAASDDPAMQRAFSFSHDAQVSSRKDPKTGRQLVESIDAVSSVDVVARGATTRGIFEGYDMVPPVEGKACEDGMCEGKPYHHHVANAMHAVATHPTMDPDQKKAVTGHLMKSLHGSGMDQPLGGGKEEGEVEDVDETEEDRDKKKRLKEGADDTGQNQEGADAMSELEQLRLEKRIRATADSLGVAVDDAFLAECVQEGFDGSIPKLAERQKKQRARESARPKSAGYGGERAQESADDVPRTAQDFLARIAPGTQRRVAP